MPDLPARRWLPVPAPGSSVDAALAVALLVVAEVDIWRPEAAFWGDDPVAGARLVNGLLLGGLAVSVAWRRSAPLTALAVGSACVAVQALTSGEAPIGLLVAGPVLLLVYAVAAHASRRRAWIGLGCVAVATAVHDATYVESDADLDDASWWWLVILLTWLVGLYVGTRRRARSAAEAARQREDALARTEQEVVTSERLRIAGELHDVVAHNISVIALQAGAALELLDHAPERARDPLAAIETTARTTLVELGTMVGVLRRADDEVGAGLTSLPELAARVTAAGLPVQLRVGEVPPVPPGLDLSAYRIVQEALTNALRHAAGATQVEVSVEHRAGDLQIRVSDNGSGPRGAGSGSTGHGLAGMRERTAAFGGDLLTGAGPAGGFVVQATLPVAEVSGA